MKNLQKRSISRPHGFTLIELMIVMVIIGILTLIGASAFRTAAAKGRDAKRKGDVKGIATAVESYYSDKGKYPDSTDDGKIVGCGTPAVACDWGAKFTDGKTVYMVALPKDPTLGRQYYYRVTGESSYQLYARLEDTNDATVPHNTSGGSQSYNNTNCGSGTLCNSGTSSNILITSGSEPVDDVVVTPTPGTNETQGCSPNGASCSLTSCPPPCTGENCSLIPCVPVSGICQNNVCVATNATPTPTPTPTLTPTPTSGKIAPPTPTPTIETSPTTLVISPTRMAFDGQPVGVSRSQSVTITNTGTGTAIVSSSTLTGAGASSFSIISSGPCVTSPLVLRPGASCFFDIQFTPPSTGTQNATLNVNTTSGLLQATITGSGVLANPSIVEFHIPAGTGYAGNWNIHASMLVVSVGTTVRIINDDTILHSLHTGPNHPPGCPHAPAGVYLSTGQSYDCLMDAAYDPDVSGAFHDHYSGDVGDFWVKSQ